MFIFGLFVMVRLQEEEDERSLAERWITVHENILIDQMRNTEMR